MQLGHYGTTKFATKSTGSEVTGALTATTIVKSGGSSSQYLMADGSVSTTVGVSTNSSNIQATWSVTSNGSSAYRFTGPGNDAADDNPDLYLVKGQRYRFINNSGGSHPFQIRASVGGSAYSAGVTNNGASSGNIEWNVQHDAPARLYYQCTAHSGMVGNIYITGGGQWENTSVAASGTPEIYTDYAVGIGTVNPLNDLDVNQSEGRLRVNRFSHLLMQNKNDSTTDYWGISARNGGELDIGYGTPDGNSLIGGDKLTISSGGNLGIGTANPGERLHLTTTSGNCKLRIDAASAASVDFYNSGTRFSDMFTDASTGDFTITNRQDADIIVRTNGTNERLRVTSAGLVGIGTNNPSGKLNIVGSDTQLLNLIQDSGDLAIRLNDRGTGSAYIKVPDNTSGSLTFETGGSERLRIDSGGRLITGNYSTALDTTAGSIIVNGNTSGGRIATRGSGSSANTTLGEMFGFWDTNKVAGFQFTGGMIPQIKMTDRLSSTPVLLVLLLLKDFV